MVDLIQQYNKAVNPIGDISARRMLATLDRLGPGDNEAEVYVKGRKDGMVILSNGKILRCVEHYYKPPEKENTRLVHSDSMRIKCENVRTKFGLDAIASMDCISCHKACLRRFQNRELAKKK